MVRLRKISPNDLEIIMNWRMLPEVTLYMYTDPTLTIEDQLKWYERVLTSEVDKYWIIQIEQGINVGLISLNNIDYINCQCSWAYYIADVRARGKGLGTMLECNIYDYVFNTLGLNKLWCEVLAFNQNVIAIHQKFGSTIEGEFKHHIKKNGQFFDVVRMAIRKEEWLGIKGNYNYSNIAIE